MPTTSGESSSLDETKRPEPAMKRWPHPIETSAPSDPVEYYVRCALSYQNQLLAEIKTLLERLIADLE